MWYLVAIGAAYIFLFLFCVTVPAAALWLVWLAVRRILNAIKTYTEEL